MSKRNLVIIIALLVVVDIAAAFWYLSLRIENSGESHDLWGDDHNTPATVADTLTNVLIPDTFDIKEYHAYYASTSPAIRGNQDSYYICVKRVKARWPRSINGNDSLPVLERALVGTMFGSTNSVLASSATQWCKHPQFTVESITDYREVKGQPKLVGDYGYSEQVLAFPILTSMRLLVMEIDHRKNSGGTLDKTSRYLHYDRVKQTVLSRNNILERSQESTLLSLINDKIDQLNQDKQLQLERAAKVANEFHATRKGIIFEYPAGEIAPATVGPIEVLINYPLLGPVLTDDFKVLLNLNDGYWTYKPISHEL